MITYKDAGVDISKADEFVKTISRRASGTYTDNVLKGIGGFCSSVKIPAGIKDPIVVSGTDGVGTKLKIAFATGIHNTVGIDLVAMCVNDIITCGAQPLFFLDYFACGKLDTRVASAVMEGIVEGCKIAGIPLVGGETAELPSMYREGEYDMAGFAVGVVERNKLLDGKNIKEGDVVIGLPSNGLHSNGFSLVRTLLLEKRKLSLNEKIPPIESSLADELLKPTRIYTKEVKILTENGLVKGIAHITGGGIYGNAGRIIPDNLSIVIKYGSWPVPPIFKLIEKEGVTRREMLSTFNMGIGMIAILEREKLHSCLITLEENGISCYKIGDIVNLSEEKVEKVKVVG